MSRLFGLLMVLAVVALPTVTLADDRCAVPLADWQPSEVLRARLERAGWTILRFRVDDGCYLVIGIGRDGERMKARFDPATLEPIERGDHDGHDRHGHRFGREGGRD